MVLVMKESARQKGIMLVYSLHFNTAAFCLILFIIRYLHYRLGLSDISIRLMLILYYISTVIYYIYSITQGLRSYFYAYALGGRKRSRLGAGLWFFLSGILCLILLAGSWTAIASFGENVRALLDSGAIRWLIVINIAAGLDVIIAGILSCCLLSTIRKIRRARLALA